MKTAFSARFRFSDWPNPHVPDVAAGVYAIWHDEQLIYCGMSGRELEKAIEAKKSRYGLVTRLESHSRGRLSGDQFCVYVANRIVIPALKPDQIQQFSSGEISLDRLTKEHIQKHSNISKQWFGAVVLHMRWNPNVEEVRSLERCRY